MYKWVKTSEEHTVTREREGILSTDHRRQWKGEPIWYKGDTEHRAGLLG